MRRRIVNVSFLKVRGFFGSAAGGFMFVWMHREIIFTFFTFTGGAAFAGSGGGVATGGGGGCALTLTIGATALA